MDSSSTSRSAGRRHPRYPVRRRHPRYQVRDVRGSFPLQFEAEVLNMSLTGLAVECQRALEIGREYEFTLQTGDQRVDLRGIVQWSHLVRTERFEDEVVPVYQSGLDFRSVLNEKAQELLAFLQHHVVIDADRRIFGRFKLTLEGPATVTARQAFVVQVISFSGMLIETEVLLDVGSTLDMELRAGDRTLRMTGRVANSQRLSETFEERGCRAGIAFHALDEETVRGLEGVMTDYLAK